jgi:hypothetical protein
MMQGIPLQKIYLWIELATLALGCAATARAQTTIPSGKPIQVILNQSVSSENARVGEKVDASVAESVRVNGRTLIPRGSSAYVYVASVRASGHLKTPARLWLRLDSVRANGRTYTVSADWAGADGKSHKTRNIVAIGGGTAVGAILGGIFGGGKGAAIGAAAGAGAGAAGAAITGKKDIKLGAETKLNFVLKSPVTVR